MDVRVHRNTRAKAEARAAAEGLEVSEWHRRALAYSLQHMPRGWPDAL